MNELMNLFGQPTGPQSFDSIRISIASPEQIRSWSFGLMDATSREWWTGQQGYEVHLSPG